MGNAHQPLWPAVDPDQPPPRRRRAPVALVSVLAVALAALGAVTATATTAPRMIGGVALPAATAATGATTTTTTAAPTSTSTKPAPRRFYLLEDHPLLVEGATLPDTECKLPAFRRDKDSLRAYYTEFVGCMDDAWSGVLSERDMPHAAPDVNTAEHPGETGCGDPDEDDFGEFTAMYCPRDQTLYLPIDRLKAVDHGTASSHLAVVAHEYGHHVQQLSGIMGAAAKAMDEAGDESPEGLEMSRRVELQANCFAGLALAAFAGHGTIGRSLATQAVAEFRNGSLQPTHGSRANQQAWASKGFRQRSAAACNTFTAKPKEVG